MENNFCVTPGVTFTYWGWEVMRSARQAQVANDQAVTGAAPVAGQIRAVVPATARPLSKFRCWSATRRDLPPSYKSLFGIPPPTYAEAQRQTQQQAQRALAAPLQEAIPVAYRNLRQHPQATLHPEHPRQQPPLALHNEVTHL
jgi:hypothetical protein